MISLKVLVLKLENFEVIKISVQFVDVKNFNTILLETSFLLVSMFMAIVRLVRLLSILYNTKKIIKENHLYITF